MLAAVVLTPAAAVGQVPDVDLAVSVSDAPDPVQTGSDVVYTVTVSNQSADTDATEVVVTNDLPAGLNGSGSPSQGSCLLQAGSTITCALGGLSFGSSATVDVTVTTTTMGAISFTASVDGVEDDSNAGNNSATEQTSVEDPPPPAAADLRVEMTGGPETAKVGYSASYTVTVHNDGPSDATGVQLTDVLPSQASGASSNPGAGVSCNPPAGGEIHCDFGSIVSGANKRVGIDLTLSSKGTATNQASASGIENDPNLLNNSASQSTQVLECTDVGTSGNDTLTGTPGNDVLCGVGGNDQLIGLGGNDKLDGGPGNDTLEGGDGSDQLFGRADDDTYQGGPGFDSARFDQAGGAVTANLTTGVATGGDGADTLAGIEGLIGSNHGDTLVGDRHGNDFIGRGGNDTIKGGKGFDYVRYDFAGTTVTVNLDGGAASGGDDNDTLGALEGVIGSIHADVLRGNSEPNIIIGGLGNDRIKGGRRFDYVAFPFATGRVVVNLARGKASGADGKDRLGAIEGILGSPNNDRLLGDRGANTLAGRSGNDTVKGGKGGDALFGEDGNDNLFGGGAGDYLNGGVGGDDMNGGIGTDRCEQGGGSGRKRHCELR